MDNLPSPVLHVLCSIIWESHPPSLYALSLVNSTFYHAAVPLLYNKLILHLSTRQNLSETINELIEHPLRHQYLTYTRSLNIDGKLLRQATSPEDEEQLLEWARLVKLDNESLQLNDGDICSAAELEPRSCRIFTTDRSEQRDAEGESSHQDGQQTSAWSPLVALVEKSKNLVEINYACVNQFPPILLDALHRFHPSCKLNLDRFRFLSLNKLETDPYELGLIRSPCLHGLGVRYVERDSDGHEDYNGEALLEAVKIAPNLKQIKFGRCAPAKSRDHWRARRTPKNPWKGFIPSPSPPVESSNRGNLARLTLTGFTAMGEKQLNQWRQLTNLSKLRSLAMGSIRDPDDLMCASGVFTSLEKLAIDLKMSYQDENSRPAMGMFFESLPPLKTLRLQTLMDMGLIHKILATHGSSLLELQLKPFSAGEMRITSEIITQIADFCPLLEELDIIIKRSQGDRHETACYKALGKFPSLKRLSLRLDCSLRESELTPIDEMDGLDQFDKQRADTRGGPPNIHMCDMLSNGAVDEKLARSIWDIITSYQVQQGSLLSLRIDPYNMGPVGHYTQALTTFRHISQHFKVSRDWRVVGGIKIVEIGRNIREHRDEQQRKHEATMIQSRGCPLSEWEWRILQKTWGPFKGQDWRLHWRSRPLDLS